MGIQESYNRVAGEIQSQKDLISQIRGVLANKAASGGGVELPELDNQGSASDVVEGMEFYDMYGVKVTGKIPKKSINDIVKDGIYVTVPAGYYAVQSTTHVTVPTETKTVTSNGTYTPSTDKYFSSVTVNVPTSGGSGGYVIKTGTAGVNTTSNVINTGLSDIEQFFISKSYHAAAGLIFLRYSKTEGISRLYSTQWTSYSKNVNSGSDGATVSGGTVTLDSTTATSGGLSANVTYTWVAIGTE